MQKFKSRDPIESVLTISPNEDIEKLTDLLNELADLGWYSNQWSKMLPNDDDPALLEMYPTFPDLNSKEKRIFMDENYEQLPFSYFIESFGHETLGYLRTEGKSLGMCAEKLVKVAKRKLSCDHTWSYTHNNGNKTCSSCGAFTSCTVEEALSHYEKGTVEVDEALTLVFHNGRPICECGSHQVYYLQHSMFNEKQFECFECKNFLPLKFSERGYSSIPVYPNDDAYKDALQQTDNMYDRHRFRTLGVVSEGMLRQRILQYLSDMLKHYLFVEKERPAALFVDWVTPYIYQTVAKTKTQIKIEHKKYQLKGLKELDISLNLENKQFDVSYKLDIFKPDKENEDPEALFKGLFESLLNNEN